MQSDERNAEWNRPVQMVLTARRAIVEHTGGKRRVQGEIVCPLDGGTLRYSVASNGHVHASCSNDKCVHWME